ncbi:family 10 glycosylhydrolase [Paenibacillus aceris]|uniref:SpoIID/LytB domain protein n=1 Tax=Paenibacillus aceris TaxID=869555 RepID=A0ABS4I0R8_9BACL|nr:family 10 glycosylhydrolase [Paenibacillus aceris]MBP1964480.1 SpoIID/LytB domain protein [Paenibacillus aceris]NHW35808.1 family 10 glycosylhydrolase [Paenibacillus aceris]
MKSSTYSLRKKWHASVALMLLVCTIVSGFGSGLPSVQAQDATMKSTAAPSPLHEKVMAKNAAAKTIELASKGVVALSDNLIVEQQFGERIVTKTLNDVMVGAENVDVYLDGDGKAARMVILGETPMNRMRVGIRKDISNIADMTQIDHPQIDIKSAQGFVIKDKADNKLYPITAGTLVSFTVSNGETAVMQNGAALFSTANRLFIEPVSVDSLLQVMSISRGQGKPQYRGTFELFLNPDKSKLRLINEVDIEQYLYQVVPSEMPSSFGLEALKAQSIAARTYALTDYMTSRFADLGFHIDDSTLSQVYNNQAENALTTQAVQATAGKIMKSGDALVDARFYSASGGYGASKHEVWQDVDTNQFPGTPLPYLTGRSYTYDPANNGSMLSIDTSNEQALNDFYKNLSYTGYDSDSPYFRWKVSLTKTELQNTVNKNILDRYAAEPMFVLTKEADGSFVSKPIPQEGVGTISTMYVTKRGAGGNAMELVIEGSTGTYKILREFNIRFTIRPSKIYTGGGDVLAYRAKGGAGVYDNSPLLNPSILYSAFFSFDLARDTGGVLTSVTFFGGGNGHGVGMSQNGAQMLGQKGWTYDKILDAYYKGMRLVDMNAPVLRRLEVAPKLANVNPGAVQSFTVKGFDGSGNEMPVPSEQLVWSQTGSIGTVSSAGELTAVNGSAVGKVVAAVGDASGDAGVIVGKPTAVVEDFENITDIVATSVRTVPNSVQLMKVNRPDPVHAGTYAGKFTYDFTGTTGTSAAYLNFKDELGGTGRVLEGYPKKLGAWVYGDGQKHWLRAMLQDSAGTKPTVDFTSSGGLNWSGWKYVTIDLPSNLKPPIRLNQIYLVETSDTNKNGGTLYVDQVTALYANTDVFELELSGLSPMVIGESKQSVVYATYGGSIAAVQVQSGTVFYSSDPAIATVDAKGIVNAKQAGTTTITAIFGSAPPAVYELKVTAEAPVVERLELAGLTTMEKGQTKQTKVFATYAGDSQPVELASSDVVFSSSVPDVASVDVTGKVTALKAGQTTITAAFGGQSVRYDLVVTNPVAVLQSIDIQALSAMTIGDSQRPRVTALYSLTPDPVELTSGVIFKSSNPAVATVDDSGNVTALKVGYSMITASFGGKSDYFSLVVNKATTAPKRELRAAWIASVENIDWPQKGVVTPEAQKQSFTALLDDLAKMGMNAVVVQVKPTADAFYPSEYGPWSEYLTGEQGKDPGYDPLAFMVEEAHKRNMEFHAWFNPYRVSMKDKIENLVANHPARQHPDWVVSYGGKLYYNPGVPAVKDFVIGSIMEVVRNYDIDSVHMDDYFYPYVVDGKDFPDDATYQAYGAAFPNKGDWRRDNVNKLVHELSTAIKHEKSYVKFGISPFGVWRNLADDPTGSDTTAGQRNYDDLYADTRTWIHEGWIDYITPQIYWNFGFTAAAYEKLIDWWTKETQGTNVHLYIGHAVYKINANNEAWENPDELPNQLKYNLNFEGVKGSMHFSAKDLQTNPLGIKDRLTNDSYKLPALIPSMPWIDATAPEQPKLDTVSKGSAGIDLSWKDAEGSDAAYYVIYRFDGSQGGSIDNPAQIAGIVRKQSSNVQHYTDNKAVEGNLYTYAVTAVDRVHNESVASNYVTLGESQNRIELEPIGELAVGATKQARVISYGAGSDAGVDVTSSSQFTSSHADIATIEPSGLITALKEGTSVITATYGTLSTTSTVQVTRQQGQTSAILVGQSSVLTGQPFTVQFGLRNVTSSVYAQDITIEYDAAIADYVSAASIKDGVSIVSEKAGQGKVRLILASEGASHAVSGDADLVQISFQAKKVSQTTAGTIAVSSALLGDAQGHEIEASPASIRVEVVTQPPGQPGDANGDNKYTIGDLAFAAAHYGENSTNPNWNRIKVADYDGDGVIDIKDLASIARKIME